MDIPYPSSPAGSRIYVLSPEKITSADSSDRLSRGKLDDGCKWRVKRVDSNGLKAILLELKTQLSADDVYDEMLWWWRINRSIKNETGHSAKKCLYEFMLDMANADHEPGKAGERYLKLAQLLFRTEGMSSQVQHSLLRAEEYAKNYYAPGVLRQLADFWGQQPGHENKKKEIENYLLQKKQSLKLSKL